MVLHVNASVSDQLVSSLDDDVLDVLQLLHFANQGHHDVRGDHLAGLSRNLDGSLDHSIGLHLGNFRIGNGQTAAAMAHHGVELMQADNNVVQLFGGHAHILCQGFDILSLGGQELMQRRVQITDGHRTIAHDAVHSGKVSFLERLNLSQSNLALFNGTCADHLTHSSNTILSEEHMLGTAQANAFSAHINSVLCIARVIGVGHNLHLACFVSPAHKALEVSVLGGSDGSDLAFVDVAGRAINAHPVTLMEGVAVNGDNLCIVIDSNIVIIAAAGNTAGTHATCNNSCVAGHAAADGQDALRNLHADDIFGAGFQTNQNDLLPSFVLDLLFSIFSAEDNATAGRSRRSGQALADCFSSLQGSSVKLRVQQGIQLLGLNAQYSGALIDNALINEVAGDLQSSLCGALAVTGLQHKELAIFDGELHVLHILVVVFQAGCDLNELIVNLRHFLVQLADRGRSTDAGNDIFALSIDQVLAHQLLFAGSGVTGESNTGAGTHAGVTESHLLNVDSSAPLVGDFVHLAVNVGARVIPRTEDGLDSADQLFFRILRELFALLLQVDGLELLDEFLQVLSVQLDILLNALALLHSVDTLFKEALAQLHDDVRVHLDEAAVAVICKTGVRSLLCQTFNSLVVQAQVQDGIHHAGHRLTCTGTNGNQQRVLDIAELLASLLFQDSHVLEDVSLDLIVDLTVVSIVLGAGFGGDGEALRNRHAGMGHFCQTSALAAQNVLHGRLVAAKCVMALFEQIQKLLAHRLPPTKLRFLPGVPRTPAK